MPDRGLQCPQLAGTVTAAGADFTPTSAIEKSGVALPKINLDRTSLSAIQNQRHVLRTAASTNQQSK